jgi:hypothetical protein
LCAAIILCGTVSPYFISTVASGALLYLKKRIESWKMKKFNQKLIWVSIVTLALTACGSNDDSASSSSNDEHDHEFSILVSQSNTSTLSLLEEGPLEALDDAAAGNGATLVLSETAAYAAVLSSGTVNFVHGLHDEEEEEETSSEDTDAGHEEEAHVLDFSLTGSKVITTSGHFAVLDSGTTTFVAYDDLETITSASEDTSGLSVTEIYPALILDEEHDLKLVFDGTDAVVYEGLTQEHSFTCATPTSLGQTDELIVVSCGTEVITLVVEENSASEHTFTDSTLTLDGTDENYVWRADGHVIVGFEPNTTNYAVIELDDSTGNVEVVKGSDSDTFTFAQNICAITLDSAKQDILAISAGGAFVALGHEGNVLKTIALSDFSAGSDCDDFVMASAAKTVLLVDNNAQKGYEIDVDEPEANPNGYHVHEDFDLDVSDIVDMVIFHEKDGVDDEHDH